jgi:hypothetical protein
LEVGITGKNFGRGPSKNHSTKVWLQLAQWFPRRRFLCEFPIGTGLFMNFELLPIFTDYANKKKGGMKFKKKILL